MRLLQFFLFTVLTFSSCAQKKCVQKTFRGSDNPMVCVCNSTYCDEFPPLGKLYIGQAAIYTSSQSGKRFERTDQIFNTDEITTAIQFTVDTSKPYQRIIGFGGAFTDAASLNFMNLSQGARQNLVNAYFGQQGIGYTIGRVPMASCDFSWREYSYDDVEGDFNLTNFALANEDVNFKIPFIKKALEQVPNLKLFSSPWAAPGWMKTNGMMHGWGTLKGDVGGQYYQTWAKYFIRFFEEYAKQGVNFWGLTVQNEPNMGNLAYQEMSFTAEQERDFVKLNLGPAIRGNSLTKGLKLMVQDTNYNVMPDFPMTILNDPVANQHTDGVAIHWYADDENVQGLSEISSFTTVHNAYPNKWMLYTEACTGWTGTHGPIYGDWGRGVQYAHNIMEHLYNWITGWTDWNMALDLKGGPNWVNNLVDSPIIVNATSDEFYKNPMYYALGHFSKFIVENSTRVDLKTQGVDKNVYIEGVVFLTPSNQRVLVLNNRDVAKNYAVTINDASINGKHLTLELEARSFTTIVWSDPN